MTEAYGRAALCDERRAQALRRRLARGLLFWPAMPHTFPLQSLRSPSDPTRPLSVLLAEDERDLRELLAEGLEADGAVVACASDGAQAFAQLFAEEHATPDVVLADERMPGKSGTELLRDLRAAGVDVPVVLITGVASGLDTGELDALGNTLVLEKPFDFDDLRTALYNIDAISRLRPSRLVALM